MEILVPLFLLVIALASVFGLTADTHESREWAPREPADAGLGWRSRPY
ncbi:hypothetical protein [Micromonospora sp. NBC_01796]|nr:hypothetical protein [Micromonospora sp. NBC_01796]WSA88276.1 hypothetical protein OIE47_12050 [Micromonospora sp. NBC_01796]